MTDYLIGHVEWNSPDIAPVLAQKLRAKRTTTDMNGGDDE